MDTYNLDRFGAYLNHHGLSAALLSNPATLTWLSGYAPPIQTGPNPFEGGPALGWWQDGQLTLVLSDGEAGAAAALGAQVRDYLAFTVEPMLGMERQGKVLEEILLASPLPGGKIGVEVNFLPARLAPILRRAFPGAAFQAVDGAFDRLRAVKSAGEVEKIRAALGLCDLAQATVAEELISAASTEMSEIELWGKIKSRMEAAAGGRLPVLADLVAGTAHG